MILSVFDRNFGAILFIFDRNMAGMPLLIFARRERSSYWNLLAFGAADDSLMTMKRSILTFWAWVCLAACPGVACAADQQQDSGRKNRQQVSKAEDQADSQFEDNRTSAERGQYVDAPDTGSEGTDSDTYKIFQAIVNHKADDLADLYEEAETGITPTRTGTDGKQQQQQAQPQAADPTAEPDASKMRDINSDVCFGSLTKDAQDSLKQRMDQRELLVRAHINKLGSLTPLALAAYYGDEKMVETLLDRGKASPEKTVLEKQTPLMLAAFGHNKRVIQLLLNTEGKDAEDKVTEQDAYGMTAMHYAIIVNDRDILAELVNALGTYHGGDKSDAPVNTANMMGYTPLHYAAQRGNLDMFKLLLDKGGDYTIEAKDGETALMAMCAGGHREMVQDFLTRLRRDPHRLEILNAQDKRGNTPVLHAIRNNKEEVAKMLILDGVDLRLTNEADQNALMFAAAVGNKELILECVKVGLLANEEDNRGRTALIFATINGHTDAMVELARVHADPNHYDENGLTAYLYAKAMDDAESMTTLAGIGADPEAEPGEMQPEKGWGGANPALMDAIEKLKVGRVRALLKDKRDAQDADFAGNTPLMILCAPLDPENRKDVENKHRKMAQILDMLLKKGADPNAVNANGQTALMRAASDLAKNDLNSGMIYEIMKKGAYLNDRHGFTHANALCYCGYESMDAKEQQEERWGWRLLAAGARVRDIQGNGVDALYASCDTDSRKKQKEDEEKKREEREEKEQQERENSTPGSFVQDAQDLVNSTVDGTMGLLPTDMIPGQEKSDEEGSDDGSQEGQEDQKEKSDQKNTDGTAPKDTDKKADKNSSKKDAEDLKDYVFPGMCRLLGADSRAEVHKKGSPNCTDALRNSIVANSMRWFIRIITYRPPNSAAENTTGNRMGRGQRGNRNGANRGGNRGNRGNGANRGGGNRGGNGNNRRR